MTTTNRIDHLELRLADSQRALAVAQEAAVGAGEQDRADELGAIIAENAETLAELEEHDLAERCAAQYRANSRQVLELVVELATRLRSHQERHEAAGQAWDLVGDLARCAESLEGAVGSLALPEIEAAAPWGEFRQ